jgi:UPF0755 protein
VLRWLGIGLLVVVAVLAAGTAGIAYYGWSQMNRPLTIGADGEWLEVRSGSSLASVSRDLAGRNILDAPRTFTYLGRLRGEATRIQAGEYLLPRGLTGVELLDRLVSGQVYLHQLTAIEGWRFTDLLAALDQHPAITVTDIDPDRLMADLGVPGVHPEGQFAPDTYRFPRGTTDLAILEQAYRAMQERLASVWAMRSPTAAVESPYEALILASIIEKETALPSERREISGVFSRRLQRGMRLQTDPTVIYGLGEAFDGNLRRADLGQDTPYNTYTRAGLPPTPIALPGLESLRAAVDPADGSALYFVATGAADGSHRFSDTLEEHNRAVADYLRRLRNPPTEEGE